MDVLKYTALRPLMPLDGVRTLVGTHGLIPDEEGYLAGFPDGVGCRMDVEERVGTVSFRRGFPSDIAIQGLCMGMTLTAARRVRSTLDVVPEAIRIFDPILEITEYHDATDEGHWLHVFVVDDVIQCIEICSPKAVYSPLLAVARLIGIRQRKR
ncbi:DUF7256 domain-containing protein [Stenotrophomonas sp. GZD-301]|uniref:DUF7256 domain-containing protein n=1 Tax=Stenotrophomonas sp. GZD-301 TaxID=3404814 RepID=UPI003BB78CC3